MSSRITRLRPYQGFCAETGGALILSATAISGFPVSTTHVISGSIMGVGAVHRFRSVRWGITRRIVLAWVLSMPMAAICSFFVFKVMMLL